MSYLDLITFTHTVLSVVALVVGIAAVRGLFLGKSSDGARSAFVGLAAATSLTGFFFPFHGMTPAIGTGIVALIILAIVQIASHRVALSDAWRRVYAAGLVATLYLLVFVAIVQAFAKIPGLRRLAPTQTELPFTLTQFYAFGLFAFVGTYAAMRFRPAPNFRNQRAIDKPA